MIQHVILPDDIKEHTETKDCDCKPSVIEANGETIIVHNAYYLQIEPINE